MEQSYHAFDALGSTRQLTNLAGSTTDAAIYDAWGAGVMRTGATAAALLWLGQPGYYYDPEIAFFAVRERPYSPILARWTTLDLFFADGPNRYRYVLNRPLVLIDPSGAACQVCEVTPIFAGLIADCDKPLAVPNHSAKAHALAGNFNSKWADAGIAIPDPPLKAETWHKKNTKVFQGVEVGGVGVVVSLFFVDFFICRKDECDVRVTEKTDTRTYVFRDGRWESSLKSGPSEVVHEAGSGDDGGVSLDRSLKKRAKPQCKYVTIIADLPLEVAQFGVMMNLAYTTQTIEILDKMSGDTVLSYEVKFRQGFVPNHEEDGIFQVIRARVKSGETTETCC